jgi:acyl-coenzyme A thioesterase PaaI-like protein
MSSDDELPPSSADPGDAVDGTSAQLRVLRAIGLARRTGAPLLACVAGLETPPGREPGSVLGFSSSVATQRAGELETAMLVDFVLGGALRARVARDRPLPTLSLTVDLVAAPGPAAGLTAEASTAAVEDGLGTCAAVLHTQAGPVGHASASFAVPSRGRQPVLPWDTPHSVGTDMPDSIDPVALADLDEVEGVVFAVVTDTTAAADSPSWGDRLIAAGSAASVGPDTATLRFMPSAAFANRAGAVQGGVLVALAMRAAREAMAATPVEGREQLDPDEVRASSVSTRFVAAAQTQTELVVAARVSHRTRRTAFVQVSVTQAGAECATAGVICRAPVISRQRLHVG